MISAWWVSGFSSMNGPLGTDNAGEASEALSERRIFRFSPGMAAVWLATGLTAALLSIQQSVSEATANTEPLLLAYADLEALGPADIAGVPQLERSVFTFQVQPGDTLAGLLSTAGIATAEAERAVQAVRSVFDPYDLKVGQEITIGFFREGTAEAARLRIATIWLDQGSFIEVMRVAGNDFVARRVSPTTYEDRVFDTDTLVHRVVESGDTLEALLREAGAGAVASDAATRALRGLFNPRRLAIGQEVFVSLDSEEAGGLLGLSIKLGENRFVTVVRGPAGHYNARRTDGPVEPAFREVVPPGAPEPAFASPANPSPSRAAANDDDDPSLWAKVATMLSGKVVSAEVARPAPRPGKAAAPAEPSAQYASIDRGETLMGVLVRAGVSRTEAEAAIDAFKAVFDPRKIRAGQVFELAFAPASQESDAGRFMGLALDVAPERRIVIARADDGSFRAQEVERSLETETIRATARIASNLYEAAADAGIPVGVLMDLIRILSYDVDFQRDIQKGDRFELLFDSVYTSTGEHVRDGPIHYAALEVGNTKLEFFRFETSEGRVDYFDAKGHGVRKALLRTPIDGARLSSTYGMREHPILGYTKMHKGLDFAAVKGTPVMAAGDGVIEAIGRNGGYGKYIRIRHGGSYSTAYAHLNSFAKGLKKGSRVDQGDIIGYVGATGLATGPHLHYEVLVSGEQVNPMSVKLPTGMQLAGADLDRFQAEHTRILTNLETLPALTQLASVAR